MSEAAMTSNQNWEVVDPKTSAKELLEKVDEKVKQAKAIKANQKKKKTSKAKMKRDQKAAMIQRFTAPSKEQQGIMPVALETVANPVGRPSNYSLKLAQEFCARIAEGHSLRTVCKEEDMPGSATVFRWLHEKKEFREHYARACEERAEAYVEETFDIANDGRNDYMEILDSEGEPTGGWRFNGEAVQRSKLRIENIHWYAGKVKPKKYGNVSATPPVVVFAQPQIYIPKELPYNAAQANRTVIDVEVTEAAQSSPTTESGGIPSTPSTPDVPREADSITTA